MRNLEQQEKEQTVDNGAISSTFATNSKRSYVRKGLQLNVTYAEIETEKFNNLTKDDIINDRGKMLNM
jgi:hypothetical protein